MPRSIFRRKSSAASKYSKTSQEQCKILTKAIKDVMRRLVICYKCLCCFPLDQIVPPKRRKTKNGLNIYLKPGLCQTSQKVLPEIKIIHIVPRSRVSFYDPGRAKSEITTRQAKREITTAQVKSEITTSQAKSEIAISQVKSEINTSLVQNEIVTAKKIRSKPLKVKTGKDKTRMLKEKSRKIFDYGSDSLKGTFKNRKKSSSSFRNTDLANKSKKKSKNDVRSTRWVRTKRMMRISNPTTLKWMRYGKARSLSTTSSDPEESAGDGPLTPKVSVVKKVPLRWHLVKEDLRDTNVEFIINDVDKQVPLQII